MAKHTRPTSGPAGLAVSLVETLEPRRLLSAAVGHRFTVGRRITPGIQFRPATDAKPTGRAAQRHVAHTQFVQLLPKGQTKPAAAGSTVPVGLTVSQVRQAYGVDTLTFGGITGDGAGQTIAILDAYDHPGFVDSTDPNYLNSDLHKFSVAMGLPDPPSFRKLDQNGGTNYPAANAGWAGEIALDVEWAHAMAPQANIVLIEASSANTFDLLQIAANTARNLPGVSAISMSFCVNGGFVGEDYYDQFFTTPAGHGGVTFLAATGDNGAVLPSGGSTKQAGYPAESPNVVAVGGTSLQQSNGAYVSESGWAGSGGGISNYLDKPDYQSGVTLSATQRTAPDVSILADPNTGVAVYDSYNNTNGWFAGYFGGTSLSSPLWAGLVALANQGRAHNGLPALNGVSQTLPRLYGLPASTLHDITAGNNGYAAGSGYDLVTGRGTPIAAALLPALAGGTYAGRVFQDNNGDSVFNGTDTPIAGQTVFDDINGNAVDDPDEPGSVTDAAGRYTIADLAGAQPLDLRIATPGGYVAVGPTRITGTTAYGTFTNDFSFFPLTFNAAGATQFTVRGNADLSTLQIFQNTPTTGAPTFEIGASVVRALTLTFNGSAGNDSLTVDESPGNLDYPQALSFNAGGQTTADAIYIKATLGLNSIFSTGSASAGAVNIPYTGVEATIFAGGPGGDHVTINGAAMPAFTGGGGVDRITLNSATFNPPTDLSEDGSRVQIIANGNSAVNFVTSQHLDRLLLGNTSSATLGGTGHLLHTGLLSLPGTSRLDLNANTLIVDNPMPAGAGFVPGLVLSGYADGAWNGVGLASAAAAADLGRQHALGFGTGASIVGLSPTGNTTGTYLGETVTYFAAIVRYTLYGDADLNGAVDFNDFLRMQNSFGATATTWARGDFDFDGDTDFNDFLLLQDNFGMTA